MKILGFILFLAVIVFVPYIIGVTWWAYYDDTIENVAVHDYWLLGLLGLFLAALACYLLRMIYHVYEEIFY